MTQLDFLTKYVMESTLKTVNVVALKRTRTYIDDDDNDDYMQSLDEEIWYLSNQIGGSQPTCQR